ncbi:nucleotidyltransferase family protein [Herbaspirillum seropedicae]|uniref:nucleotidyltransferase family protein n=1 Tax=Herbaspirillum seropedicae TaxID=964 RepID=UPI0031D7FF60
MTIPSSPPIALLLAAGRGSRFDAREEKLLQAFPHHDGRPGMVATAAAAALLEVMPVLAVVPGPGALAEALRAQGCAICMPAPASSREMSASLRCGVQHSAQASGWLVALADMPCVDLSTLCLLRDALAAGAPIVAPVMQGRRGHPVGFGRAHLDALLALQGDQGARALLKTHPVTELEVMDEGIFADVDTAEDLRRVREIAQSQR